jgi:hypothetical protein
MKSEVSIRADSANVDVWIIDRAAMSFLPDKVLKFIFNEVIHLREYDRPFHQQDIEFIVETFRKWDHYKT